MQRIHLQPRESRKVTFTLTREQLATLDSDGKPIFEPGEFKVSVGGQQPTPSSIEQKQVVEQTFTLGAPPN
jgi:beta-glucosidase